MRSLLEIPGYQYKILRSYFQKRVLVYVTEVGQKWFHITSIALRSTILGPVLSNVMYDEVLRSKFPVGVAIVGFADDNTLEVYGESIEEVVFTVDNEKMLDHTGSRIHTFFEPSLRKTKLVI